MNHYRAFATAQILLAEDDRTTARLIQAALERTGFPHELRIVHNGEDALRAVDGAGSSPAPDLLLLDLQMPRMNGFEVLEQLKKQEHTRRIPVVMFSSSSAAADVNRAYDLHVNAYVVKHPNLPELSRTLDSVVRFWLKTAMTPFAGNIH